MPKIVDQTQRRHAVLAAAAAVFARRGYQAATMDEIAARAGIAKGSIYQSFASKEDLFFALFGSFIDSEAHDVLADGNTGLPAGNAVDWLQSMLLTTAERLQREDTMIPLMLEFWSVCGVEATRERFSALFRTMFTQIHAQGVAMLKAGQARGEVIAGIDPDAVVSVLLSTIDGMIVQHWTMPTIDLVDTMRAALPPLMAGLRPPPAG